MTDHDHEKAELDVGQLEQQKTYQSDVIDDDDVSEQEGKRIIWRVDRRLVVLVGVLYCISLMDRTNLSAAAVAGMLEELELTGNRYVRLILTYLPLSAMRFIKPMSHSLTKPIIANSPLLRFSSSSHT